MAAQQHVAEPVLRLGVLELLAALEPHARLLKRLLEPFTSEVHAAEEAGRATRSQLDAGLAELRELARGIHPAVLTTKGLEAAIDALATRSSVPVRVVGSLPARPAPAVELALYFTVAEALTNVAKYAEANEATVRVACEDSDLVVEVRDDGIGGADPGGGSGLSGLADRVEAVDGSLSVESPPGAGTLVRAVLPLAVAQP